MLIITAPGQGAQTPGFLAPWLEVPGVAERLGAASELAGCDLIRYGTTAGADEIRDTAIAQPLLVAAALAAAGALAEKWAGAVDGAMGFPGDVPADAAAAVEALGQRLQRGDVVLVKGSRAAAMENVALALTGERPLPPGSR